MGKHGKDGTARRVRISDRLAQRNPPLGTRREVRVDRIVIRGKTQAVVCIETAAPHKSRVVMQPPDEGVAVGQLRVIQFTIAGPASAYWRLLPLAEATAQGA